MITIAPGCVAPRRFQLFQIAVAITIWKVMPVIPKPLDQGPAFGSKSVIVFLPNGGRDMLKIVRARRERLAPDLSPDKAED